MKIFFHVPVHIEQPFPQVNIHRLIGFSASDHMWLRSESTDGLSCGHPRQDFSIAPLPWTLSLAHIVYNVSFSPSMMLLLMTGW